ncbi:g2184 [Coccomyxa elongata]
MHDCDAGNFLNSHTGLADMAESSTSIPQPSVEPESPTVRDLKRDLEHVQHLFSAFGEIHRMQGPQPYINRYSNSILQRAYVDFQDAQSALLAFNCFYDEDFSAAAHKLPEVQHVTNAKWPVGKLVVILGEYLPALSTTAKKQQQIAGSSQASIERPDHVSVEPQHVFSGPSRSLFQELLEEVEAFHRQQAMSTQSIMQQAMRQM